MPLSEALAAEDESFCRSAYQTITTRVAAARIPRREVMAIRDRVEEQLEKSGGVSSAITSLVELYAQIVTNKAFQKGYIKFLNKEILPRI
jgi:hypothetical protein